MDESAVRSRKEADTHDSRVIVGVTTELRYKQLAEFFHRCIELRLHRLLEPVQSDVERFAPALNQAIRIEDEQGARVEGQRRFGPFWLPTAAERQRAPILEPLAFSGSAEQENRGWAAEA